MSAFAAGSRFLEYGRTSRGNRPTSYQPRRRITEIDRTELRILGFPVIWGSHILGVRTTCVLDSFAGPSSAVIRVVDRLPASTGAVLTDGGCSASRWKNARS